MNTPTKEQIAREAAKQIERAANEYYGLEQYEAIIQAAIDKAA
jgi:hypothetical protein